MPNPPGYSPTICRENAGGRARPPARPPYKNTTQMIGAETMTKPEKVATLAGFLQGRGNFGDAGGRCWLYFMTLEHEIAAEALDLWGGRITERRTLDGEPKYKYTADADAAPRILAAAAPYFMGGYRRRAEAILDGGPHA